MPRQSIPAATRRDLAEQHVPRSTGTGFACCAYCGKEGQIRWLNDKVVALWGFHIDHVLPVHRGGTNALTNLVLACKRCNLAKGSKTVAEWRHGSD